MSGSNTTTASVYGSPNSLLGPSIFYSDVNLLYGQAGNSKALQVVNIDAIAMKIIHVLGTTIGTYEFEPKFGSNLPNLLWEPMDELTAWQLRTATAEALAKWVPVIRIDMGNTLFTANPSIYSYTANIAYTILATSQYSVLSLTIPANS